MELTLTASEHAIIERYLKFFKKHKMNFKIEKIPNDKRPQYKITTEDKGEVILGGSGSVKKNALKTKHLDDYMPRTLTVKERFFKELLSRTWEVRADVDSLEVMSFRIAIRPKQSFKTTRFGYFTNDFCKEEKFEIKNNSIYVGGHNIDNLDEKYTGEDADKVFKENVERCTFVTPYKHCTPYKNVINNVYLELCNMYKAKDQQTTDFKSLDFKLKMERFKLVLRYIPKMIDGDLQYRIGFNKKGYVILVIYKNNEIIAFCV